MGVRAWAVVSVLLLVAAAFSAWMSWPLVYWGEPLRGHIIDVGTQQPVAGAVIVAEWIPDASFSIHGGHDTSNHVHDAEVTSDNNGEYFIPGWGPKLRPWTGRLTRTDPRLTVLKAGYGYWSAENDNLINDDHSVRTSEWNGSVIPLRQFRGSESERIKEFDNLCLGLSTVQSHATLIYLEMLKENLALTKSPCVAWRMRMIRSTEANNGAG